MEFVFAHLSFLTETEFQILNVGSVVGGKREGLPRFCFSVS